jgi:hypothetical protein
LAPATTTTTTTASAFSPSPSSVPPTSGYSSSGSGPTHHSHHHHHHHNHKDAASAASGGQGDAYERKKQRAKDARVKLNESIERLSVAIALAGTQSRERRQQWQDVVDSPFHETFLHILNDCVECAESAKKWDRPSFVGSAASLIQGLNAQCESMMREIMRLREDNGTGGVGGAGPSLHLSTTMPSTVPGTTTLIPPTGSTIVSTESNCLEVTEAGPGGGTVVPPPSAGVDGVRMTDPTSLKRPADMTSTGGGNDSCTKRTKMTIDSSASSTAVTVNNPVWTEGSSAVGMDKNNGEGSGNNKDSTAVWDNSKLRNRIISFLDPLSLLRCQRVNKTMNVSAQLEDVWAHICTARFGFFNVRQWRAKLDDDEEGIQAPSSTLYRSMDRANVMGTFQHEGLFLLGEVRLPNKVSAWVFLVERSNGETMRSVRRRPDMPGNGMYTTLPIVELRTVVQNTGIVNEAIIIREQMQSVDASTRRRGEEMIEVDWDTRFAKRVLNLDGSPYKSPNEAALSGCLTRPAEMCRLRLFDSVVFTTFIHAKGCSTNSKFVQRANFTKILVAMDSGVTVPLVVPFPRDSSHLQH